ncbi:hypothetical protein AYL99_06862 [Fonsecaea erecta]|uniref:Alpha/beta hydrolase fold-3 domain-containing protein n=1 Tax=Fonsecaea erecta TaxID=1367422 RepID=A0A178ZIE5_9EURO|nr:hypothetical protein AYL99_06862 [Fonsecaea erecta]OAP59564.1 hypothetical protein AYL99_06862 [Fonsecaea erecta]
MPLSLDPEFFKVLEPLLPVMATAPKLAPGDVAGRRQAMDVFFGPVFRAVPDSVDVGEEVFKVKSSDGFEVPIFRFTKNDTPATGANPVIYYIHGGGYIGLDVPLYRNKIKEIVSRSGVQVFSPDYRVSPEAPYPLPIDDVWAGLQDLSQNAKKYGIDPARIIVMGDSGGGGLAAGLVLKARDDGLTPPVAKQVLIYPMLDDTNTKPIKALEPFATWTIDDNITGWGAYLSGKACESSIPYYAAPARVPSVEGLPPTYIDVGDLDIFRDEDLEYARRIAAANIHVELHVYPGIPHGFEMLAPAISTTALAMANRIKAIKSV